MNATQARTIRDASLKDAILTEIANAYALIQQVAERGGTALEYRTYDWLAEDIAEALRNERYEASASTFYTVTPSRIAGTRERPVVISWRVPS